MTLLFYHFQWENDLKAFKNEVMFNMDNICNMLNLSCGNVTIGCIGRYRHLAKLNRIKASNFKRHIQAHFIKAHSCHQTIKKIKTKLNKDFSCFNDFHDN